MSINVDARIGFDGGVSADSTEVVVAGVLGLAVGVLGGGVGVLALAPDWTIFSCSTLSWGI